VLGGQKLVKLAALGSAYVDQGVIDYSVESGIRNTPLTDIKSAAS
jgi:hypothetical protein